ncbi:MULTISPECIES: hypothetical protein [Protofrankia]|uniref:hypothetical protein n=1 Tax=Protofrankia TaxID=2994361 RepID=UPI000976CDD6|nr:MULTISPECIES: hypothetical protein [Protofrankia]ONH37721.1 hypothetical protein BL254_02195 [Protofrankia sp. BMG5.30]
MPSDAELWTRTRMLIEQIEVAQAEIVLHRAAYERASEEEAADRPWLRSPVERLTIARIARALAAELAAVERFRVWAEELYYLQEEARARGHGATPGSPDDPAGGGRRPAGF